MDPKALSKLCNSGGELPRLSNSCQQHSATGTEREGGCRIPRELRAVFRFVECRSPKQNLAQNRVSSTLGRNAVKPFLFSNSQQIAFFFFNKRYLWMESISVLCLRNQLYISNHISYFGNSFLTDWSGHGWFERNLISFSHIKRSINNYEIESNQAVWNLMCSNPLCFFFFKFGFWGVIL